MTPPNKPDNRPNELSDDFVDMTPANTPSGDSDDIEDMTPMVSQGNQSDQSDQSDEPDEPDEPDETADMFPSDVPQDEPAEEAYYAQTSPRLPARTLQDRSAVTPPPRTPEYTTEEPPRGQRPETSNKRLKHIILTLLVIAALGYAGNKVLGQSLGSRALGLIGGNSGAQSTPGQAESAPTPKTVQIGDKTITTAVGPLILLNPGVVRQGTAVSVTGSGFDPGSVVHIAIVRQGSATPLASTEVKADKGGGFYGASLNVPTSLSAGNFNVVAQEPNSSNAAQAVGSVAGGAPQVKLGLQVGQPGDLDTVSLNGFAPEETINVFWNTMSGKPLTTFQADGGGGVGQGQLQVPYGAVGENTFLFVGAKSQSLVAANFLMLNLYPSVKLSTYALKADNPVSFSGKGFGPGERVFVFLNSTESQPLAVVSADAAGAFKNAPGFVIPFVLKGKQTLIFMGEQSRAPDTVSFTVLPYAPVVEPSTYGGLPGTSISFYVSGFAPSEVVHVYAGHTKSTTGTMVACFQTNGRGSAADVGSYLIPGSAQGALGFALIGEKSGGVGTASVNVNAPPAPVQTAPQAPFTCPLDQPTQPATPSTSSSQAPASATPAAPQGHVTLPSQHIAAVSTVSSHLAYMSPDADLAGAVIAPMVTSLPFNVQVSARAVVGAADTRALVGKGYLPWRTGGYVDVGQLSHLASIVVGAGLMWLVVVMILTCILISRSCRWEMATHQYARSKEKRGQSGHEWERVVSEGRQSTLAPSTLAPSTLAPSPGHFHSFVPPSAVGHTPLYSRPHRAARIASLPVSCRNARWHRMPPKARLQNGQSGGR